MSDTKGFTLIELLVVISIIGILSSIVVTSLSEARIKAQYAQAQSDVRNIANAMVLSGGDGGTYLGQLTGSWCSHCRCRVANGGAQGSSCVSTMSAAIAVVDQSSDRIFNLLEMQLDPWGSPYTIDENEHEYPANPCRHDNVRSAGPDRIHENGDDYVYVVPYRDQACY